MKLQDFEVVSTFFATCRISELTFSRISGTEGRERLVDIQLRERAMLVFTVRRFEVMYFHRITELHFR